MVLTSAQVLDGSGQIWLDSVSCNGTETSLDSCAYNNNAVTNCAHSEDVGVRCGMYSAVATTTQNHTVSK